MNEEFEFSNRKGITVHCSFVQIFNAKSLRTFFKVLLSTPGQEFYAAKLSLYWLTEWQIWKGKKGSPE